MAIERYNYEGGGLRKLFLKNGCFGRLAYSLNYAYTITV